MSSVVLNVRYVANLARLDLTDEEVEKFEGQLNRILEHVDQLSSLDISGVEPTAHAYPVFNVLRSDEAAPGLEKQAALGNAPAKANGLFLVTKVLD